MSLKSYLALGLGANPLWYQDLHLLPNLSSAGKKKPLIIYVWNIKKGEQSNKQILPLFLLISPLSSIWQNGSHTMGDKENRSFSLRDGRTLSQNWHPLSSLAMGNYDCLSIVCTTQWNRKLLGHVIPALRGLQSDKKSKNS